MPTVLITGASRGIGLEFSRQYAAAGWTVLACCRDPAKAGVLKSLGGKVAAHALDVTDDKAVSVLAGKLKGIAIDVLINNAGIAGKEAGTLGSISSAVWQETLRTNTIAPLKVAEAFIEHVAGSKHRKLIAITSRLGSIALNDDGDRYAYRSSKAALNMVWKSLAIDTKAKGLICAVFHPGWVRTDMGGASAPVTPADSAAGMIKVIGGLKAADSGRFFNYDGQKFAW